MKTTFKLWIVSAVLLLMSLYLVSNSGIIFKSAALFSAAIAGAMFSEGRAKLGEDDE